MNDQTQGAYITDIKKNVLRSITIIGQTSANLATGLARSQCAQGLIGSSTLSSVIGQPMCDSSTSASSAMYLALRDDSTHYTFELVYFACTGYRQKIFSQLCFSCFTIAIFILGIDKESVKFYTPITNPTPSH